MLVSTYSLQTGCIKKGDPISLENMDCLCWIIYPERIKGLLLLNANADELCKLEMLKFNEEADLSIEELQKKVPQKVVDLMINKVKNYVYEHIKKQAILLHMINLN